jgi:hypothetical protein
MRGSKNRSTLALPPTRSLPNAFNLDFLHRFRARDVLAPSAGEANAAGPWVIEELSPKVFGVSRVGMGFDRGYSPTAIFFDRWLALVAAAVLPGLGQTPLIVRRKREDGGPGYEVVVNLYGGPEIGFFGPAAKKLVGRMNTAISLLRSPESLAYLLEAASSVGLERTGAILDEQISGEDEWEE